MYFECRHSRSSVFTWKDAPLHDVFLLGDFFRLRGRRWTEDKISLRDRS